MVKADISRKYALGLDFGTESARAVLVSVEDGTIISEFSYSYPHGVITGKLDSGIPLPDSYALADARDYRDALHTCVSKVIFGKDIRQIVGIGISATTYTMVPCTDRAVALSELPEFQNDPMAYIKLWKHHGAVSQAEKIMTCYNEKQYFPVIERYGGAVNCEWALPKLLETYENAPNIFRAAYRFCDLGEWIAWLLTGHPVNSTYSLGFTGMWASDLGFPEDEELNDLLPGFAEAYKSKFAGKAYGYEQACGRLSEKAAEWLNLEPGIPVASPIGDGSCPGVYFCYNDLHTVAVTLGTSIAIAFVSSYLYPIKGINGVVKDGIIPGYYGYDAGQPSAGDMLDWFIKQQIPKDYYECASKKGQSIYEYLSNIAAMAHPWENQLTVLDWFNGNRSILNKQTLKGVIAGYTLRTKPENIYCALVQGLACGTRKTLDYLEKNGIVFDRVVFCGGIAEKNSFILGQYANVLGKPVFVSAQRQVTALSAAILGAIAAGIPSKTVIDRMVKTDLSIVEPDPEHTEDYERIYKRWDKLHDLLADYYNGE